MQDKISIIIPIYNVENYLVRCLESVIHQTYDNLEIILVDDGSPDQCGHICDEYKEKDDRIIVIHQKNKGLSEARNAGIEVATGSYVLFVDSDDYIEESMVEHLYNALQENFAQISCCNHIDVYDDGKAVIVGNNKGTVIMDSKKALSEFLFGKMVDVVAWNKLYDIRLFSDIRFRPNKLFEDHFTTYLLLDKADVIVHSCEPLYYYCKRKTSIGGSSFSERTMELKEALDEECEYIKKKYPELINDINLGYLSWMLVIYNKMLLADKIDRDLQKKFKEMIFSNLFYIIISKKLSLRLKIQLILLLFNKSLYSALYCWYVKNNR